MKIVEIWKPVPGMKRLVEASSFGRIRLGAVGSYGCKGEPGQPRTGNIYAKGKHIRMQITLRESVGGRRKSYRVARLVCAAFHGEPSSPDIKCLHIDENGLNNRPENLKWGTQKENLNAPGFIAYCHLRLGENSPRAKWAKRRGAI